MTLLYFSLSSQKEASLENSRSVEPVTEKSEKKEDNVKLADRLTSGLLNSLLEARKWFFAKFSHNTVWRCFILLTVNDDMRCIEVDVFNRIITFSA